MTVLETPSTFRTLARRFPVVRNWLVVLLLLVLVVVPFQPLSYLVQLLIEMLIFGLFAMSLDLLLGYTGMVSFGHAAFFGIGAYVAGIIGIHVGPQLYFTFPAAIAAAALAALVIGFFAIRTSGVYFLLLTLAFSQMVYAAIFKLPIAGGSNGLSGIPRPTLGFGLDFGDTTYFYYLVLIVFLASFWLLRRIVASPFGRSLHGIKENEPRMRAIGYSVQRYKLTAFMIAGAFAGAAGALRAYFNFYAGTDTLYWTTSGQVLVTVIIGGAGTLVGPALGAGLVIFLERQISSLTEHWPLLLGTIFILFVLRAPHGIVGLADQIKVLLGRSRQDSRGMDG